MCPYASGKRFLVLVCLVALVILAMTSVAICAVLAGKDGVIAAAWISPQTPAPQGLPAPKAVYAAPFGRCTCTCDPLGRNRGAMSAAVCGVLVGWVQVHNKSSKEV